VVILVFDVGHGGVTEHHVTMSYSGGNSSQTRENGLWFDSERTYLNS